MICGHAVGAQQGKIFNVGASLLLFTINSIVEADNLSTLARDAKAQGKGLAGGGAAIAFFPRKFAHPGIEQPRSLGSGAFAVASVGGSEVPIGEPFLKNGFRRFTMQRDALGLLIFFVPAQAEPLQPLENRIDRRVRVSLDVG